MCKIPHCIDPFISEWTFEFFHFLATNNAAVNVHGQVFECAYVFTSFGYIPRSGIPGSYTNVLFNLLKKSTLYLMPNLCYNLNHKCLTKWSVQLLYLFWDHLVFGVPCISPMNFWITFSIFCKKGHWECIEYVDHFWSISILISSNPHTWEVFPFT